MPPKIWTEEKVIREIQKLRAKGEKFNYSLIKKRRSKLFWTSLKYFGSWKNAVNAAGFDYAQIKKEENLKRVYSAEKIIQKIQRRAKEGKHINSNAIQIEDPPLYMLARRYFGSWGKAIHASGFLYSLIRQKVARTWTKSKVIEAMKERYLQNKSLGGSRVQKEDQGLYQQGKKYFGSWQHALIAAGFDPKDINWRRLTTKKRVVAQIHAFYLWHMPLYGNAMCNSGHKNLFQNASRLFGNWEKAIEAAGIPYEEIRWGEKFSPEKVISEIKRLGKEGVRLNHKYVFAHYRNLHSAGRRYFGSWAEAVYAAGIDYLAHSWTWSTKAWIKKLKLDEKQKKEVEKNISNIIKIAKRRKKNNGKKKR